MGKGEILFAAAYQISRGLYLLWGDKWKLQEQPSYSSSSQQHSVVRTEYKHGGPGGLGWGDKRQLLRPVS